MNLKGLYERITNLGVKEDYDEMKAIALRHFNRDVFLLLIIVIGMYIASPFLVTTYTDPVMVVNTSYIFLIVLVLYLNANHHHLIAKSILLVALSFSLFYLSSYFGPKSGFHFYFIVLLGAVTIHFLDRPRYILFAGLFISALFLTLWLGGFDWFRSDEVTEDLRNISFKFAAFFSLALLMWVYYSFANQIIRQYHKLIASQKDIREKQRYLRKVLDLTPNFIFAKNRFGKFTLANRAVADTYGASPEELIGKTENELPELTVKIGRLLSSSDILKPIRPSNMQLETLTALDGQKLYLQTVKTPIQSEQEAANEVLTVAIDVTAHYQAEEALRLNNQKLTMVNQELDHFVYHVSHDLRAPLTYIMSLVEFLKEDLSKEDKLKFIEAIGQSVSLLDNTTQDILHYSRLNRLELTPEKIDLAALARSNYSHLTYLEGYDKVGFTVEVEEKESFYSDPRNLTYILRNLLSNALKYSDLSKDKPLIAFEAIVEKEFVRIKVSDNGIGIEEKHLQKIFDMFFRATATAEGSGLGLFIVNMAVRKANGDIKVRSKPGAGTAFEITLPNLHTPQNGQQPDKSTNKHTIA